MGINKDGLIVPKFGALFTAAELSNPIANIASFTLLAGPSGSVWNHWGHLSRENLPEISEEGGDVTTLSTWLEMNTDSETAESVSTCVYSFLQLDAQTLSAAVALNGTKGAAFELWTSGLKRLGIWYPSVKYALTGRPSPNGTDQYAEAKLTATILKPGVGLNLSELADPSAGRTVWPSATAPDSMYFDNSAFATAGA